MTRRFIRRWLTFDIGPGRGPIPIPVITITIKRDENTSIRDFHYFLKIEFSKVKCIVFTVELETAYKVTAH